MANQPPPMARPLFRLASLTRPAPATTPEVQPQPSPPAPQPRPPFARPPFTMPLRPPTAQPQLTQPQEPAAPPPTPSVSIAPPRLAVPPPSAATSLLAAPNASSSSTMALVTASSTLPSSPKPLISPSSSSLPTSQSPKAAPSSSLPTSSTPKAATSVTTTTATTGDHVPTPTASPKIMKPSAQTLPQSPKIKPFAPPQSPLTLPPSQLKSEAEPEFKIPLEAEQKKVLVQKMTIEKPKATLNRDSQSNVGDTWNPIITNNERHEVKKDIENREKGTDKKFSDYEKVGMRVTTIAGKNKGALMELGHLHMKHDIEGNRHGLHQKNNPISKKDGNEWGSYSNGSNDEGTSKMTNKSQREMAMPSPPVRTYINSNVQGVNNSILYNSSFTHHDPGVHLVLPRKPTGGRGVHLKDHIN
ncbi:hypothetical protein L1049_012720 [Liquidambar formosana]|uniref:Uncharacterized protein n=1 Tax=Liquidambar formosana TaxID=63359 RepID=A0AAP0RJZ9_LIQFO